jgi:hypothetical protein
MTLRSTDIARAQRAVRRQFDLVRRGVLLEEGSGMAYTFTRLNDIKPEMVAAATKDARSAAEQFAKDSNTGVGGIKQATRATSRLPAATATAAGGAWPTLRTSASAWSPRSTSTCGSNARGPRRRRRGPLVLRS